MCASKGSAWVRHARQMPRSRSKSSRRAEDCQLADWKAALHASEQKGVSTTGACISSAQPRQYGRPPAPGSKCCVHCLLAASRRVVVTECVEGGNAAKSGLIEPDDVLIAVTAVKAPASMSRFERKLIPCKNLDYDTIVAAIGTNESPRCDNVILQFMRPSACDEAEVETFLEFFEVPPTHVFRTN